LKDDANDWRNIVLSELRRLKPSLVPRGDGLYEEGDNTLHGEGVSLLYKVFERVLLLSAVLLERKEVRSNSSQLVIFSFCQVYSFALFLSLCFYISLSCFHGSIHTVASASCF